MTITLILPHHPKADIMFTEESLGKFRDLIILGDEYYLIESHSKIRTSPGTIESRYTPVFYRLNAKQFGFSDEKTFRDALRDSFRAAHERGVRFVYATHVKRVSSAQCSWCGRNLYNHHGNLSDDDGNPYCSSACKQHALIIISCQRRGVRPTFPGAWAWTCTMVDERDGKQCRLCGSTDNLEYHHLIPVSVGGDSMPANIAILCHECHTKVHRSLIQPAEESSRVNHTLCSEVEI